MIFASDFKKGTRILFESDPYVIMDTQTQTPSARGAATLVKVKMRNLRTDQVFDKSFKAADKFEEPDLGKTMIQYLYADDQFLIFMDMTTFDQFQVEKAELDQKSAFLQEGMELKAWFFEGRLLDLELPVTVDLEVVEVEPGTKGDTVQGSATKPATLENGLRVQVPLYIESGETIKVSTKDGKFVERAKR